MAEKLRLSDFDILGIITLNEVQGIEKYVTPVKENRKVKTYLSRSKEYYNVKTMLELSLERANLRKLLTRESSKRNFVILENMLNCSGRVYFKKFQQYIESGKSEEYLSELESAKECMMEDIKNIIVILQNKGLINVNFRNNLPVGDENSEKRAIEMDNKAMLYMFAKSLNIDKNQKDIEIVTPGYGSIYIGPFIKAMHGHDFTNMLKSKYIEENSTSKIDSISALMSNDRIFKDDKIVLAIDDNIGTGATMLELKEELKNNGVKDILTGAIQYNWRNYYRVSTGDKKDIDRFEADDFEILTPINYAGHKLYKHAISLLHSSGKEYIEYIKSKSYRKEEYCDLKGAVIRGVSCAKATGLNLTDTEDFVVPANKYNSQILDEYKNNDSEVRNLISKCIIESIIEDIKVIDKQHISENIR